MNKIALYQKYRPNNLEEMVGQDHVKKTLANSVRDGRLSHAYLFTGIRGTGKCLDPETLIFTDKGIFKIGELAKNDISNNKEGNVEELKINILGKDNLFNESSYFYYGGKKKTKEITTKRGYKIKCSLNHPILVFDKNLEFKYKKAEDILIGDIIPISRANFDYDNGNNIQKIVDITEEEICNKFNNNRYFTKYKNTKLPTIMSEDMSYLLGYIIGDGHTCKKTSVGISCAENDMIILLKNIIKNSLNTEVSISKDKRKESLYNIRVCGLKIRIFLKNLGIGYNKSNDKVIPHIILKTNKNNLSNFISGLFDSDGIANENNIELTLNNENIIRQLHSILTTVFGIHCSYCKKYNKKYDKYYHSIRISCIDNLDIFFKNIGVRNKSKFKKVMEHTYCGKKANTNIDIIPYVKEYINLFKEKYRYNKGGKIFNEFNEKIQLKGGFFVKTNILTAKNITYAKLNDILCPLKQISKFEYNKIKSIYDKKYFYDTVKDIKGGEGYVCDLNIPKSNSFVSNSIVSHNTSLARILGKIVNCEDAPRIDYPNDDKYIKMIDAGKFPDIRELDAASNNSIDDIREIRREAYNVPMIGKKRVFIIDEVHCLRGPACSALLKILEEPPAHSMFILATTDPQKVLPTIHSRCQRFQLKKLKQSEIIDHLRSICEKEEIDNVEEKALQAIARASGGSVRDALSNLDAVIGRCGSEIKEKDALDILGMAEQKRIFDLLKSICSHDYKKSILLTNLLVNGDGKDPKEVFINLLEFTNDMLISKSIGSHEHLFIEDCILKDWVSLRDTIDFNKLVVIVRIISSYMRDLAYMPRPDLVLNTCIVHLLENTSKK